MCKDSRLYPLLAAVCFLAALLGGILLRVAAENMKPELLFLLAFWHAAWFFLGYSVKDLQFLYWGKH